MSDTVQITLTGGQTVVVEILTQTGLHQSVQARISDPAGGPEQTVVIDSGVTTPPLTEDFRNLDAVPLRGGGFAVAYDDETWNQGIGQDRLTVVSFDAAGFRLGSFQTLTDSDLSVPDDAFPHLTPLANGGFAATAQNIHGVFGEGPAAQIEFYDDHAARLGGAHLGGSFYPPALADSTQGVIVTFRTTAGDMREVVGTDGHLILPAAAVDTNSGTSGDDLLNGGPGPDSLVGGAGDDTLVGGPGFDSLDGGPGSNLYVFTLDGSVDQAVGFDPAHDHLKVVTLAGASAAGFNSVLALDLRSHVLSLDGDGDAGPQAPVPVALLPGVNSLNYGEMDGPGFWPGTLRVTNVDGSHIDYSQWLSTSVYRSQTSSYDPQGRLFLRESTSWAGTHSTEWFDASGAQAWDHLVATYDFGGSLLRYQTFSDDTTQVDWRFDPHDQEDWQRQIYVYKGAGPDPRLETVTTVMDDGSHNVTWEDNPSQQPWKTLVAEYDTSGALTNYNVTYDNGEQVLWSFDPHNTEPLNWKHEDYDSAGRLVEVGFVYDDGSSKIAHFDVDNSQPWQMIADVFDPTGRQTGHWIYYDDGSIVV